MSLTFPSCIGRFSEIASFNFSAFRLRAALCMFVTLPLGFAVPAARAQSVAPQFVYTAQSGFSMVFGFQLNTATGALTPVPGSPFNERLSPSAMAVNPAGTLLFIANGGGNNNVSVFAINTATGALTEVPNSPFATGLGANPTVLATDPSGKFLYVGNQTGTQFTNQGEIDAYSINAATGELKPTANSTLPSVGTIAPVNVDGLYVHPNGRWIYFQGGNGSPSGLFEDKVQGYVIDPSTGDLSNTIPVYTGSGFARGLAGDPAGAFLIDEFGQSCISLEMLAISSVDGSLTQEFDWSSVASELDVCEGGNGIAVDSKGALAFMSLGSFFVSGGQIVPAQVSPATTFPHGPWVADLLGPFMFAQGSGLNSYLINPATGVLTEAPGSPYSAGNDSLAVTGFPLQNPAPGAQFSPSGLQFTNSTVGVPSAPQMIDLVNTGTATLNVTGISVTGTNAGDFVQSNTCAATLAAGAKCTFTITFTPGSTLAESASIRVTDNAAGSPHLAPLTSTGVVLTPPAPSLNPISLTFASTSVGSSTSMSFSITNSGDQALTVSSVTIGGANPGDFAQTNSCGSVNGNSSCPVNVVFQPKAAGQRTATVNVSYGGNLGGGAVTLTGQGAAFTVAPSGPTTATVAPGQPANYSANFVPAPGFTGTATFTCTVAPAGPGCNVTPSMLQVVASNAPTSTPIGLMVNTTASAARRHGGAPSDWKHSLDITSRGSTIALSLVLLGLGFSALLTMGRFSGPHQMMWSRVRWNKAAAVFALAALCAIASCGGGGSGTTPPPQPQNFTVTLTTMAGATTQSVNYSLTVQ